MRADGDALVVWHALGNLRHATTLTLARHVGFWHLPDYGPRRPDRYRALKAAKKLERMGMAVATHTATATTWKRTAAPTGGGAQEGGCDG